MKEENDFLKVKVVLIGDSGKINNIMIRCR